MKVVGEKKVNQIHNSNIHSQPSLGIAYGIMRWNVEMAIHGSSVLHAVSSFCVITQ